MTCLRIESLNEIVIAQARSVLDRLFFPRQMRFQLRQIDMMNKTALYYLEHLDAFQIMESHIMDRVMQEYWQSNLDASGSFLEASTAYGILTHTDSDYNHDFEAQNRFYMARSDSSIEAHRYTFKVVRRSMEIRYFFEMAFFLINACAFQYYVMNFTTVWNVLVKEVAEL